MGELYLHDLGKYIKAHGCKYFIETGTGKGTGLEHALAYNFEKLYSIEIIKCLYDYCVSKFNDTRLSLFNDNSIGGLTTILTLLDDSPALFWLDAHFPGADFHYNSYDHMIDQPDLHKPLRKEIDLIKLHRPNCKDVIIIDDLQIYEDGPFELLNQEFKNKYGEKGSQFIFDHFSATHNFSRDYRHQGFLILTPKI